MSSTTCIYACLCNVSSSLSISLTIFAILICTTSYKPAAIIACLFPLAPACANPLKFPNITILSDAITSAPEFTSPSITTLPSTSNLCPERKDPL